MDELKIIQRQICKRKSDAVRYARHNIVKKENENRKLKTYANEIQEIAVKKETDKSEFYSILKKVYDRDGG